MVQAEGEAAPGARAATGSDPTPGIPGAFLRRIATGALTGVVAEASDLLDGLSPTAAGAAATWQDGLESALAGLPLRVRPTFLSAREAVGAACGHTPLVCFQPRADGAPGWICATDRVRGRARIGAPGAPDRWLRPDELAAWLGLPDVDAPRPWVIVEATLPAAGAGAAAAHGDHDGKLTPLRRLWALVRADRADLWAVVLYAIVIGALTLATPIAVQQLVNTVAFGGLVQPVVVLALLLFGGLAFSALLSALQTWLAERLQRRVFVRVTMEVAERLPRVRVDAFDHRHGPELVNRIFDVFTVQKEGAALLLDGSTVVLQTVVGLVVLSFYHPLMLGFSVLLLLSITFLVTVLGRRAVETAVAESNAKYAVASWLEELARHPLAFHNAAGRAFAVERADRLASKYVTTRHRHFRIVLRQLTGALGLQVLASSAVLGLGGALVVNGQLTLGQLVASELIVTAIVAAVAKLGKHLESLYDLLSAVEKLGVLLDLPLEPEGGSAMPLAEGPAALEARDLRFGFGDRDLIDGLTFRLDPGQRVALVGPTGSGKSILLDLISGLRPPRAGLLTLDDVDVRLYKLDGLRERVARVGAPEIFSASLLDNVRLSRASVSDVEVDAALERLGLADDVRALPQGLRTPLSTEGWPLSPGQVACLMLARAIVTQPRLLLLDEAFGAMEEPLRSRALDGIFAADAPWTILAVSDRPDVLARCERVIEIGGPPRSTGPDVVSA